MNRAILVVLSSALVACVPVSASAQNHALVFDGVDDYVSTDQPFNMNGSYTLEAWVKLAGTADAGRVLANRTGGAGYDMDIVAAGDHLDFRVGHNGSIVASGVFTPGLNTWAHVAASFDAETGTTALFVDGDLVDTRSARPAFVPSSVNLTIGAMETEFFSFHGLLDEVRIWSEVLSQATIQSWMGRPVTGDHPRFDSLEGYWGFNEGSGQVAASFVNSPGNDGTLGNSPSEDASDPQWQTDGAPVPVERTTFGRIKARH